MKKIIAIICLVILSFTSVSCSGGKNEIPVDDGTKTISEEVETVADEYIVRKGSCDYVIVTENAPSGDIQTAAAEFGTFFAEATGINLPVIQDKETTGKEKKIISLGSTSYARLALGSTGEDLGKGSYRVATKDKSAFVVGGSAADVLAGTYRLLKYMFGYKFYQDGVYEIAHDVKNLNYFKVDKTVNAAIPMRADYSGMNLYGSTIASKRLGLMEDYHITVGTHHNSLNVLDMKTYQEKYPEWYATSGQQLCFTAHGDENKLNAMTDTVADYFVTQLMKEENLTKTYAAFSMMDVKKTWCECSACKAAEEKYGAKSGGMLVTCDRIGKRITEKLAGLGDDRTIKIVTLLYLDTENVPVEEKGGKYVRNSNLGALENVMPMWACITRKTHALPWSAPENASALDMLDRMNAAFDEFWVWDYGVNFGDYLMPFDTFNAMAEDMKILSGYNIGLYLYQLANSARNVTGFNSLKLYLLSELMVDPTLDVGELTDDYFVHAYGNGGEYMKKIYDEYRTLALYNSETHDDVPAWNQSIYSQTMLEEAYWKRGTLKRWLSYYEKALAAIGADGEADSSYPANSAAKLERNIMTDGVFVRYIYGALYLRDSYDYNVEFKLKLYYDVQKLGFSHVKEQADATANYWPLRETLDIGNYL